MSNNTDFHKEKEILIDLVKASVFAVIFAKNVEQCKTGKEAEQFTNKIRHGIDALYGDINPDNMTSSELIKILIDLYIIATELIKWNDESLKIMIVIKCIKFAFNQKNKFK